MGLIRGVLPDFSGSEDEFQARTIKGDYSGYVSTGSGALGIGWGALDGSGHGYGEYGLGSSDGSGYEEGSEFGAGYGYKETP